MLRGRSVVIQFYRLENWPRQRQSIQTLATPLQSLHFQSLQRLKYWQGRGPEQLPFLEFGWKSRPRAASETKRSAASQAVERHGRALGSPASSLWLSCYPSSLGLHHRHSARFWCVWLSEVINAEHGASSVTKARGLWSGRRGRLR